MLLFSKGYAQNNQFEVDTDVLNIKLVFNYSIDDSTLHNIAFTLENKMDTVFVFNNGNYDYELGYNALWLYYPVNTNTGGLGGEKVKLLMILPYQIIDFQISINRMFDNSFDFYFFYCFIRAELLKDFYDGYYPLEISHATFDQLFEYAQFNTRINLMKN